MQMRSRGRLLAAFIAISWRSAGRGPWLHHPGVLGHERRFIITRLGQVTDDPGVVHAVSRGSHLRMGVTGQDFDRVELPNREHLLAQLGVAVSLPLGEAVVIYLGL